MSAPIDEKVVALKFQSDTFKSGVASAKKALADLKGNLNFDKVKSNLSGMKQAANDFDLSGISRGVENISSKFNAMGAIGFSVLNNLTNKALAFGQSMIGSVLDPIIQGGRNRAGNIEQARFQFKGLGLDVEQAMSNARDAVTGTAYGLDEAAAAAGNLSASQVALGDDMTQSLRAIAGVAAQTGSEYGDIANIFQGVAGNTRLMGDDLNQLAGRGLNAAAILGKAMGKSEEDIRSMVTKGKISFKDFSTAMYDAFGKNATKAGETYDGALSNMRAAMSRIGAAFWTPKMEADRDKFNALGPMYDRIAKAIQPVITAYGEFQKMSSKAIVNFVDGLKFENLAAVAQPLTDAGMNIIDALKALGKPIIEAFQEIFPPASTVSVVNIANAIRDFTEKLKMGGATSEKVKNIFKGVFSIFKIAFGVVKGLLTIIGRVFQAFAGGGGSVLDFGSNFGELIEKVANWLTGDGDRLAKFFETLGTIILYPVTAIKFLGQLIGTAFKGIGAFFQKLFEAAGGIGPAFAAIGDAFANLDFSGVTRLFGRLTDRLQSLSVVGDWVVTAWGKVKDFFAGIGNWMKPGIDAIGNAMSDLGGAIGDAFESGDFNKVLDVFNTGFLGAITFAIIAFIKNIKNYFTGGGIMGLIFGQKDNKNDPGMLESFKGIFTGVTDTLSAMQQQLKAKTLLTIAIAIGVLAASVIALSLVDSGKLTSALTAITVMFGQLMGSMALFNTIVMGPGIAKLPVLAFGLILLGGALLVMSAAVTKLSKLDWNELLRGLTGVAAVLGMFVGVTRFMGKNVGGMVSAAFGMVILGAALLVMAKAVKSFSDMEWDELIRGLSGVAAVLVGLAIFQKATAKAGGALASAVNLLILGVAMQQFAKAVSSFADLSWEELARGLVGMAGALIIIAGAMLIMPQGPMLLVTAAGLVVVAYALTVMADAMKSMGKMSWEEIGKSMVVLAGSLILLAAALYAMTAALPGAAALVVASVAIGLLVPSLIALSQITWGGIGQLLGALGLSLLVIAAGGIALLPAIPGLLGLGVAIGLIGLGIGAVTLGIGVLALGLVALGTAGPLAAAGITAIATSILDLLPLAMQKLGEGIVAFADVISNSGPTLVDAFTTLILSMLNAINTVAPQILDTMVALLMGMLQKIDDNVQQFVDRGASIIIKFINGLASNNNGLVTAVVNWLVTLVTAVGNNAYRLVNAGGDAIMKFITALGSKGAEIADKAGDVIVDFVNSLATSVDNHAEEMRSAGARLAGAIVDGMSGGLFSKASSVAQSAFDLGKKAISAIKNAVDSNSPSKEARYVGEFVGDGLALGMDNRNNKVGSSATSMGVNAMQALRRSVSDHSDMVLDAMPEAPVIRPVVDLSDVKRGAAAIDGMMGVPSVKAQNAYATASAAESGFSTNLQAQKELAAEPRIVDNSKVFELKQTNNSPEALPAGEIWRNTKNIISQVEEELSN